MRISDWSSDVCSSDLTNLIVPHPRIRGQRAAMTAISLSQRLDEYFVPLLAKLSGLMRSRRRWRVPLLLIAGLIFLDRKSVVEGKRVSVRVDLGGRRIIKKKAILM